VYAVPRRLMQAVAWFAGLTGVQPVPGGSHHGRGTANFLVGLGAGAYLEIIEPDPHQPQPPGGRWFGIDRLTAPVSSPGPSVPPTSTAQSGSEGSGLRSRPAHVHVPTDRCRDVLRWRLTPPQIELHEGLVPLLIDWDSTPHPTSRDLPKTRLSSWAAIHPTPEILQRPLAALGCQLHIAGRPASIDRGYQKDATDSSH
jgi:Glyoxalase-like domain